MDDLINTKIFAAGEVASICQPWCDVAAFVELRSR